MLWFTYIDSAASLFSNQSWLELRTGTAAGKALSSGLPLELYLSLNLGLRGGFNEDAPSGGTCCLDLLIPPNLLPGPPPFRLKEAKLSTYSLLKQKIKR